MTINHRKESLDNLKLPLYPSTGGYGINHGRINDANHKYVGAINISYQREFIKKINAHDDILAALKMMINCFKDVPEDVSVGFDSEPEPKTQWDMEAMITLNDARTALTKHGLL